MAIQDYIDRLVGLQGFYVIKLRFREDLSTLWIEVSRREKGVPLHLWSDVSIVLRFPSTFGQGSEFRTLRSCLDRVLPVPDTLCDVRRSD